MSCMTVDRRGFFLIDTPKVVKEHNIIEDKILPYIAEVLEYNNPSGTPDPQVAQYFRTVKTVNNMNYDKFVDCQDYALLFYALCKYYNIDIKDTVAFGDSMNDKEIIEESGFGIAMGNAIEELKKYADYVTDDITDNGVYNALEKFGYINTK